MRLRELRAKRNRVRSDLRKIDENPSGDGGDLSEEQQKRFTELKTELENTENAISRAEYLEDAERREQGTPLLGQRDDFETATRDYSLQNLIRSQLQGESVDIGREREVSQEISRRDGRNPEGLFVPYSIFQRKISQREVERRNLLTTGTGGNLVSTDHRGDLYIDELRDQLVIGRAGAMTLTGLSGNIDIPKGNGGAVVEWIGEDEATTKTDPSFTKVQMTPKTVACRTEVSRNMITQSSPEIEQLIREQMAAEIAVDVDRVAIRGGGSNEPTGIIGTSTNTVDFAGEVSWSKVLSMVELCEVAKEFNGNAFILGATLKHALRTTVRVAGTDSRFIMESANTLADYPAFTTGLVNEDGSPFDTGFIFGNFRKLMIGIWGQGFDFLVNPYESTAYSKGNIQLRAMMSLDVAVRNGPSFTVANNLPETLDIN